MVVKSASFPVAANGKGSACLSLPLLFFALLPYKRAAFLALGGCDPCAEITCACCRCVSVSLLALALGNRQHGGGVRAFCAPAVYCGDDPPFSLKSIVWLTSHGWTICAPLREMALCL